jgi:hypothetical protein
VRSARVYVEHDATRPPHALLRYSHVRLDALDGRSDQDRVMDRRQQLDAVPVTKNAGDAQNLGASALHRPIPDRTLVEFGDSSQALPAKDGPHHASIECRGKPPRIELYQRAFKRIIARIAPGDWEAIGRAR